MRSKSPIVNEQRPSAIRLNDLNTRYVDLDSPTDEWQQTTPLSLDAEANEVTLGLLEQVTGLIKADDGFGVIEHQLEYRSRLHAHDYLELTYVVSGTVFIITRSDVHVLNAGDCILIPQGLAHAISPVVKDGACPFEMDFLIGPKLMERINRPYLCEHSELPVATAGCVFIPSESAQALAQCLDQVVQAYYGANYMMNFAVFGLLLLAAHELNASLANLLEVSELEQSIRRLVLENPQDASIESIARHLGYSNGYFSRLVKSVTGKSPVQLVGDLRLDIAQRLLRQTNLPIAKVAESVGYKSASHFHKVFLARYRQTPQEFRDGFVRVD